MKTKAPLLIGLSATGVLVLAAIIVAIIFLWPSAQSLDSLKRELGREQGVQSVTIECRPGSLDQQESCGVSADVTRDITRASVTNLVDSFLEFSADSSRSMSLSVTYSTENNEEYYSLEVKRKKDESSISDFMEALANPPGGRKYFQS